MAAHLWQFEALDRLFFRDGRPFNAGEMAWVESQFPPTGQTLQGAVRTAVLTQLGADYEAFCKKQPCVDDGNGGRRSLTVELGDAGSLGELDLTGPFVLRGGELMFPAPLDLVKTKSGFGLLCVDPAQAVECDLGRVCLPRAPDPDDRDVKTQEGKYLTYVAMEGYLAGSVAGVHAPADDKDPNRTLWPLLAHGVRAAALADREPKIGLERNDETRTSEEGMLYSIAFVRPRKEISLGVFVAGLDGLAQVGERLQALGGEGKLAGICIGPQLRWPPMPPMEVRNGTLRFKLVLTTPALWETEGRRWRPPAFAEDKANGILSWRGPLCYQGNTGVRDQLEIEVISACIGKPLKVGGWDMAENAPRALTGYIPAGSLYFCRSEASNLDAVTQLHCAKIGCRTEYGFGHILIGKW
jgi:CRISPR-associated protein Cmr3